MQELTTPPTMRAPYGGDGYGATNAPMLGTPIPGTTGGLPAKPGLSVQNNPLADQLRPQDTAQHTQSFGRGNDTMLVHMTPNEVNSLQGLALATGGSLTINPHTGLPEAGWLGKLLPTILGAIATPLTGGLINPLTASMLIGAGTGIAKGSLKEGLMAGLQAYGGAALGSAAGLNAGSFGIGQAAHAASALPASVANTASLAPSIGADATAAVQQAAQQAAGGLGGLGASTASALPASIANTASLAPGISAGASTAVQQAAANMPSFGNTPGFMSRFATAARAGLPAGTPGIIAKNAPMLAGMGVMSGLSNAMTPKQSSSGMPKASTTSTYTPYRAVRTALTPEAREAYSTGNTSERLWFSPTTYEPEGASQTVSAFDPTYAYGLAKGGTVNMDDGAFVVDARTVSELGNGSSNAGIDLLRKLGGQAVEGPGDGVSDSVRAKIGGKQEARVARDEVIFPPEAVQQLGGTKKLYALMDKAHKARKKANRGEDTKVSKGLAALA